MKQKCIECQYFERESLTTEVLSKYLKDAEFLGVGLYPIAKITVLVILWRLILE